MNCWRLTRYSETRLSQPGRIFLARTALRIHEPTLKQWGFRDRNRLLNAAPLNRDVSGPQVVRDRNYGRTCESMSSNCLGCQIPARSVNAAAEAAPCSRQIEDAHSPRPKFQSFHATAVPGRCGPLVDTPAARCQKAHEGNCVRMSQASR
jgi:hypothetical protein